MKYVLWDWNGTLFDDLDACRYVLDKLLENHGLLPRKTVESYREVFCFPIIEFYKNAGFDFSKTPYEVLAREYMDMYIPLSYDKEKCKLNPDAKETLKMLDEKGYKQIILSASKLEILKEQVSSFGIEDMFSDILGIKDIYAKSKADVALKWKEENAIKSEDITVIGDSLHDYEIASLLGARCFLHEMGHQKIPESKNYEKVKTLKEFGEIL